jgi:Tol biopolymer transport system component
LVEYSKDFQAAAEIPFSVPPNCGLSSIFAPRVGGILALELNCPTGQTVLYLDTNSGAASQPVTDSDSHFLAWTPDGKSAYLKVDSLGNTHIVRASTDGAQEYIPVTNFTYDLEPSLTRGEFTFAFSRGLGQGSELWLAKNDGKTVQQLVADRLNYVSFARYSPDGRQIAFIKIPDTQIPFTVGELWAMDSNGAHARKLAEADAGHGYAASWSPDGKRIALVVRENPEDEQADQTIQALISNIYVVEVASAALAQVTHLKNGRAETPSWSPDGNTLAFNVVINDRMEVRIADVKTGEMRSLAAQSTCCPAWLRK